MSSPLQSLWMLCASLLFSAMGVCIKYASFRHHLGEIVLFRGLPSVLILSVFAWRQSQSILGNKLTLHLRRNLSGCVAMWLGFYAVTHLPLGVATTLNYTSSLFMAAFGFWAAYETKKDSTHWLLVLAVVMGFCGVLLIYNPFQETQLSWLALLAGLGGGALGALAYMSIGLLGKAKEPEWRTVLLFSLSSTVTGLLSLSIWGLSDTYSLLSITSLLGIGLFGMLAQLCMTRAFSRGQAIFSSTLQYSTIVFAVFWGEILWQESISSIAYVGIALVIGAGVGASYLSLRRHFQHTQTDSIF